MPVRDVKLKFIKGFEYFLKVSKKCNHNSALKYVKNFKKIVRHIDGDFWIQAERTKTKSKLWIPLLPSAIAILEI